VPALRLGRIGRYHHQSLLIRPHGSLKQPEQTLQEKKKKKNIIHNTPLYTSRLLA